MLTRVLRAVSRVPGGGSSAPRRVDGCRMMWHGQGVSATVLTPGLAGRSSGLGSTMQAARFVHVDAIWARVASTVHAMPSMPTDASPSATTPATPASAGGARGVATAARSRRHKPKPHRLNTKAPPPPGASTPMTRRKRFKLRERKTDPLLGDLIKQFYKRVHPDLLGKYPELKAANEKSLGALMGLVDDIKTASNEGEYPPARQHDLTFYVRTDEEGHFLKVPVSIRTTGAECRNVVAQSLFNLFKACGMDPHFRWGDGFWNKKHAPRVGPDEEEAKEQA